MKGISSVILCFGVFAKFIQISSVNKVSQTKVCGTLISAIDAEEGQRVLSGDTSVPNKWMRCNVNLNEWLIEKTASTKIGKIQEGIARYVIPLINNDRARLLICAIKEAALSSVSDNDTKIGQIKRCDLESMVEFSLAEILANAFYYAVVNVRNNDGAGCIEKVTPEYLLSFADKASDISIREDSSREMSEIDTVLKNTTFDVVFRKLSIDETLELKNSSSISLYYLDIMSSEFDYSSLCEYLYDCVGQYVMSRVQIKQLDEGQKIKHLTSNALRTMRHLHQEGVYDELGQMLVFAFLEEVLHAPKLLSKVEITESDTQRKFQSEAIHIYKYKPDGQYQLVFGTSAVKNDIINAIDYALDTIKKTAGNRFFNNTFLKTSLTDRSFDEETLRWLRSIIVPEEFDEGLQSSGFGIFIGYSLDLNEDDNALFRQKAIEKMKTDIQRAVRFIYQKIREYNLEKYHFYFYFLPLNNAERDKQDIIEDLING